MHARTCVCIIMCEYILFVRVKERERERASERERVCVCVRLYVCVCVCVCVCELTAQFKKAFQFETLGTARYIIEICGGKGGKRRFNLLYPAWRPS